MSINYKNVVIRVLLALLALSFILAGFIGFFGSTGETNIAKINKEKVSVNNFITFLNNKKSQLYQNNLTTSQINYLNSKAFKMAVLKDFILNDLIDIEISKLYLEEPEEAVMNDIYNNKMFKDKNGIFDLSLFRDILSKNNLTEQAYINYMSSFNSRNVLFDMLSIYNISNNFVDNLISKTLNKYVVADIYTILPSDIKFPKKVPTDEEISNYYETNKSEFFVPEQKVISYVEIDLNSYTNDVAKNKLSQLEDLIISAKNIDEIAEQFNTNKKTFIYTKNTVNIPEDLNDDILQYEAGVFSDLIYKENNKYKVFYIEEIIQPKFLSLEESKQNIINSIINKDLDSNIIITLNNYIEEMQKSNNKDKIALQKKLKLHKNEIIYRNNIYYPLNFVNELFSLNKNTFTKPMYDDVNKVYTIGYLKDIRQISEKDTNRFLPLSAILNTMNASYNGSVLSLFEKYLFNSNKITINEKLLNNLE